MEDTFFFAGGGATSASSYIPWDWRASRAACNSCSYVDCDSLSVLAEWTLLEIHVTHLQRTFSISEPL